MPGTSPRRVPVAGDPKAWPKRPNGNRGPPSARLGHDGALVRSTPCVSGPPTGYVRAVNAAAAR